MKHQTYIGLRVPTEDYEEWQRQANREDRKMAQFIRRAVRIYLAAQDLKPLEAPAEHTERS